MSLPIPTRPLVLYAMAFALALVVPTLIFCAVITWHWVSAEQERYQATTIDLTQRAADEIDRFIEARITMLQALATSPALDAGDFSRFDQQGRDLLEAEGIAVILRDPTGQQRVNTRKPFGTSLPQTPADADRIMAETKRPYVSDLTTGHFLKLPMVVLSVPVTRAGKLLYILDASMHPLVFADLLQRSGIRAPYFGTISDRNGLIIARSINSSSMIGQRARCFSEHNPGQGTWSGTDADGQRIAVHFLRSSLTGWQVSIGIEEAALVAPLTRSIALLAGLGAFLAFIAIAVSLPILCRMLDAQRAADAATQSYAEAEARQRMLADALPQMVWVMSGDRGDATYSNRQFRGFYGPYGATRSERFKRLHPEDSPRFVEAWDAARTVGQPYEIEARLCRQDGVYRWHKLIVIPVRREGEVVEWLGTALDIDDILTARRQLEETTDLLRLAQEAAEAGLWEWNVQTGLVRHSAESARMHGIPVTPEVSSDCVVEMTIAEWEARVCPDDLPQVWRGVQQAIEQHSTYSGEFRTVEPLPGGRPRWVQVFARGIFDEATGEVIRFVGLHLDITRRKEAEARVEHMALHDALTDLPNRTFFRERLHDEIGRISRGGGHFAVLCLDLDRFKAVNDTFGHPVGDALLRCVAERLNQIVRERGTVARLSGDEFVVILPGLPDLTTASMIAQEIIGAIREPFDLDGCMAHIGVSIGIAAGPQDGDDADTLFKNADIALYRAKAAGRNVFRFYEAGMDAAVAARNLLELDMREAIASGGFSLHYQPVVDLTKGGIGGFEALLRWQHPVRGAISPAEFIPIAEESGLIVPLGEWALREACCAAAAWPSDVRVAVNVSAVQFQQPGLEQSVVKALLASSLAPSRLELEITESVLLTDAETVIAILHRLRALGVRIALDDFGTGYSSLSYLRQFPFDKIKIDRSFIREIAEPNTAAIIRAVVALGTRLGIAITAEGVETADQLERVRLKGCTEVQGYLFSRPLPAAEALQFAQTGKWDAAA
ncbi:EAL domain-containing protein [Methylobacterium durans]|nr:EAL domain-containing protein [Methylobacterium durans]